jgi:hypothetical protein
MTDLTTRALDRWIQVGDTYEWVDSRGGITITEIWIDEDGHTQINGRNKSGEKVSLSKGDVITPIREGELSLVDE